MSVLALERKSQRKWAVFISGTGSNLGAVLDLKSDIDIRLIVSSSKKAFGILKARRNGIPVEILNKPIDWNNLLITLEKYSINAIFLAGFMRVVPSDFISKFQGIIINLHPSLLPSYPGLESIARAHADRAPMGCTVHHVVAEVDSGPIIRQQKSNWYENIEDAELSVHLSEQNLVREVVLKC